MQTKDFAVRFYEAPAPGQIGPQQRECVITSTSMAKAKAVAKEIAVEREYRLVEVFQLRPDEKDRFTSWYRSEHITLT